MVCALVLPLIHGLCAFFMPLLTPVSTAPFFASLLVRGLHLTVYASNVYVIIRFYYENNFCNAIWDLKAEWRCPCWHLGTIYVM